MFSTKQEHHGSCQDGCQDKRLPSTLATKDEECESSCDSSEELEETKVSQSSKESPQKWIFKEYESSCDSNEELEVHTTSKENPQKWIFKEYESSCDSSEELEVHQTSMKGKKSRSSKEKEHCGTCQDGCQDKRVPSLLATKGKECESSCDSSEELEEIKVHQSSKEAPQKLIFKVEGMCCPTEVDSLKSVLNPLLRGREVNLSFDLINAKLILESKYDNLPTKDKIIKTVAKTGMTATVWSDHIQEEKKTFWQKYGHITMNIGSAVGLVMGFIFHAMRDGMTTAFGGGVGDKEEERPDYPPITTMVFYSTAIVMGAWYIVPKAARSIKRLRPDTNVLMVAATGGAVGINHWFEAASSMYLFSAAELLEAWNMARARKAVRALMELTPSTAQVVNDTGDITEQLVEQIPINATITVKPGEKIPMDSVLILGSTSVNQAPITGESMPVQKEIGDVLFAGTINGDSVIQCRVTKVASDSTLASIIRKVEEAQSRRAKSDQWVEKFARYYVPSMFGASLIVSIVPPLATGGSWYPWIYKGLELLVISCPCSLIISTPISIVAGLTAAARAGVLIKGGIYLETAAHIKAFAMDKTGTLTLGEPVVQNIIPLNGYNRKALLRLAASLEIHSDHPLARAIQRKAKADGILYQPAERFQITKGKGAEGYVNEELFWIGSHRFLHEKVGEDEPVAVHEKIQELEATGHSIVAIGHGKEIYGLISIADRIRPESKNAIQAMKRSGIERVVMLTGDNKGAAKTIAESIGIDEYRAELLPEDKIKQVQSLMERYRKVAMVGDGINDAPAMAASSLGIAMGAVGSDAAIETADIALMSDDLGKLAWLVNHSHRTLNIIKQNVVFSLVVKAAFVGLTFANKSTLWMAMLSDMGASFIVVSNGLRLLSNKARLGRKESPIQEITVSNDGRSDGCEDDSCHSFSEEEMMEDSRQLAETQGIIGPRKIESWVLEDVKDDGNCFYLAVANQLRVINHDFIRNIPLNTASNNSLRLLIQGKHFKDQEWADHLEILTLVQKLRVIVAIVDTRHPDLGFVYHYTRTNGSLDHTNNETILPKGDPILKIAFTGDHYLSVLKHPDLKLNKPIPTPETKPHMMLHQFGSTQASKSCKKGGCNDNCHGSSDRREVIVSLTTVQQEMKEIKKQELTTRQQGEDHSRSVVLQFDQALRNVPTEPSLSPTLVNNNNSQPVKEACCKDGCKGKK